MGGRKVPVTVVRVLSEKVKMSEALQTSSSPTKREAVMTVRAPSLRTSKVR